MKRISIVIMIIMSALLFASCQSEVTLTSVSVPDNVFSSTYAVDSVLNLDGVYFTVNYSDGTTNQVSCTESSVVGFDTTTTGKKTMCIRYKNVTSSPIEYTVYNPESTTREIVSATRIGYEISNSNYHIYLENCDIEDGITACSFIWEQQSTLSATLSEFGIVVYSPLTTYAVHRLSDTKFRILIYSETQTGCKDNTFVSITTAETNDTIKLSDITITDGKKDYYLPSFVNNQRE